MLKYNWLYSFNRSLHLPVVNSFILSCAALLIASFSSSILVCLRWDTIRKMQIIKTATEVSFWYLSANIVEEYGANDSFFICNVWSKNVDKATFDARTTGAAPIQAFQKLENPVWEREIFDLMYCSIVWHNHTNKCFWAFKCKQWVNAKSKDKVR